MAAASDPQLAILVAIRLRGTVGIDDLADFVGLDSAVVTAQLEELQAADLVTFRHGRLGGYSLTPEGQAQARHRVSEEVSEAGVRDQLEALLDRFRPVNDQVLRACTRWQLKGGTAPNEHDDPAYDAEVIGELADADAQVRPILDELTRLLPRFAAHRPRLETALAHIQAGDHDWFTKPMFPSYHSAWFELHEDLLLTLGRERDQER